MKKVGQAILLILALAGLGTCMHGIKSWMELSEIAAMKLFFRAD